MLTEPAETAAKAGRQHAVPYLCGSTSEDIVPPVIYKMAKSWARLQSDQGKCNSWRPFTEWDYRLSDVMVDYISNFVKNGNPNGPGRRAQDDGGRKAVSDECIDMK